MGRKITEKVWLLCAIEGEKKGTREKNIDPIPKMVRSERATSHLPSFFFSKKKIEKFKVAFLDAYCELSDDIPYEEKKFVYKRNRKYFERPNTACLGLISVSFRVLV